MLTKNEIEKRALTIETGWGYVKCHDGEYVYFPTRIRESLKPFVGKETRVTIEVIEYDDAPHPKAPETEWKELGAAESKIHSDAFDAVFTAAPAPKDGGEEAMRRFQELSYDKDPARGYDTCYCHGYQDGYRAALAKREAT